MTPAITLHGIPVEIDASAPTDKIVIHQHVLALLLQQALPDHVTLVAKPSEQ